MDGINNCSHQFPVSSNIQYGTFYHFPLSSIFLSRDIPERSDFSSIFHVFLRSQKWSNGREIIDLNNPRKVNEKERKNQRKQQKDIEKYETKQGGIWELLKDE